MARAVKNGGRIGWLACIAAAMIASVSQPSEAQVKKTPYWASITKDPAMMRVGPSSDYPANWIYRRRDLPVKVVGVYTHWRKVQDSAGTVGWMHVRLLSDTPTAIVVGGTQPMRAAPSSGATILYRAEAGVVGRISDCDSGWCAFDVRGQKGFIEAAHLWGATQE